MQGTYEYQTKMNELSCALIHECKYAPPNAHLSNNIRNILERCNREIRREIVSKTEDGCAPLFIACRKGNVAIVNYLINVCNADIEQRGRYQAPNDLPVHCVTSLWCAAVCGHLPVVKSLIFYGAEIDAVSGLGSTPVRSACFMNHLGIVVCLVENGADIHKANYSGGTCLINSVQSVNLCRFLLQLGADVNAADVQCKTALHYAVQEHNFESTKLLLEYNANPYIRSRNNDDALQTACLKAAFEIFEYLVENVPYSAERLADAHDLMGSTCFDKNNNTQLALKYWRHAIDIRNSAGINGVPLPKRPVLPKRTVYRNSIEFTTVQELNAIELDLDALRIQSLLICERVLGPHHKDTLFRLMFNGASYTDAFRYQNCIHVWHRALEIRVEKYSILYAGTCYTAEAIVNLMIKLNQKTMGAVDNPDKGQPRFCDVVAVFKLLSSQLKEAKELLKERPVHKGQRDNYERILKCVGNLICLLVETGTSDDEKLLTRISICNLVKQNPTSSYTEDTLLHLCISRINTRIFPHIAVIRLLLECGANVNARNEQGATPLHTASEPYNFNNSLIKLLLDNGAHLDTPDKAGETPIKLISSNPMNNVNLVKYISLRCYAAQAIFKYGIPCRIDVDLPVTLHRFLESHRV